MNRVASACSLLALGSVAFWPFGDMRAAAQQPSRPAAAKSAIAPAAWPVRLKDGQPDVQGGWQTIGPESAAGLTVEALPNMMGTRNTAPGMVVDPADGKIPYLPWALERRNEVRDNQNSPNRAQVDQRNRGWPDGVPRINYYSVNPFQILQPAGAVVMLYEAQHEFRYIPLDGRAQIDDGIKLWMGSSRGHWEGTTLIVEVSNVYDRVRLSVSGDFHSDDVRITERWNFVDADTIKHSTTFVDPKVYTRPWTVAKTIKRVKDRNFEIMEYAGVEGEKDQDLMVDIPAKTLQR
jgi:hypothetical protein